MYLFLRNQGIDGEALVGIRRIDGVYRLATGEPLRDVPELWDEGEPMNGAGDCVAVQSNKPRLKAVRCSKAQMSVCEEFVGKRRVHKGGNVKDTSTVLSIQH